MCVFYDDDDDAVRKRKIKLFENIYRQPLFYTSLTLMLVNKQAKTCKNIAQLVQPYVITPRP